MGMEHEKKEKKQRKPRTHKNIKLAQDGEYRITFTPTQRDKKIILKMIKSGIVKNITDAVCECIRSYKFPPDVEMPDHREKEDAAESPMVDPSPDPAEE